MHIQSQFLSVWVCIVSLHMYIGAGAADAELVEQCILTAGEHIIPGSFLLNPAGLRQVSFIRVGGWILDLPQQSNPVVNMDLAQLSLFLIYIQRFFNY